MPVYIGSHYCQVDEIVYLFSRRRDNYQGSAVQTLCDNDHLKKQGYIFQQFQLRLFMNEEQVCPPVLKQH